MHLVSSGDLVRFLKQQLDTDVDHFCEPLSSCDSYGYTVVGKGTTSSLWSIVSRKADSYHALRSVQGSAVRVFLGCIDLKQTYFLHGGGEIQQTLLMVRGGERLTDAKVQVMASAIRQSNAEIRKLGVRHGDLRSDNTLRNSKLNRILIDFHQSELIDKRLWWLKRKHKIPEAAGGNVA